MKDLILNFYKKNKEAIILYTAAILMLFMTHVILRGGKDIFVSSIAIDALDMKMINQKGKFAIATQGTDSFKDGKWYKNNHIFALSRNIGEAATFQFSVNKPGSYRVFGHFTKSWDYGKLKVNVNGQTVISSLDLFSGSGVVNTGPIDLGIQQLNNQNTITFEVVGRNPQNSKPHFQWGFDYLEVKKNRQ